MAEVCLFKDSESLRLLNTKETQRRLGLAPLCWTRQSSAGLPFPTPRTYLVGRYSSCISLSIRSLSLACLVCVPLSTPCCSWLYVHSISRRHTMLPVHVFDTQTLSFFLKFFYHHVERTIILHPFHRHISLSFSILSSNSALDLCDLRIRSLLAILNDMHESDSPTSNRQDVPSFLSFLDVLL